MSRWWFVEELAVFGLTAAYIDSRAVSNFAVSVSGISPAGTRPVAIGAGFQDGSLPHHIAPSIAPEEAISDSHYGQLALALDAAVGRSRARAGC